MRIKVDIKYKDYFTKLGMNLRYVNNDLKNNNIYVHAYNKQEIVYVKECLQEIKKFHWKFSTVE